MQTPATDNRFDAVNDFDWLQAGPSPHWRVIPRDEVLPDAVWQQTVRPDDRPMGEVLHTFGIAT